jgi:Zn-dependent peptidase ImmA (M78 family)
LAWREDHPCTDREIEASTTVVDWMEWQASYAAAALLMPITRLAALVTARLPADLPAPLPVDQPAGRNLQQRASEAFMVSPDAAAVRLAQLGYMAFIT